MLGKNEVSKSREQHHRNATQEMSKQEQKEVLLFEYESCCEVCTFGIDLAHPRNSKPFTS